MKTFELTLRHDNGKVTIQTRADDIESAKKIVCESEGAPLSAIIWWRVVPTKKQIARTKSLLRGI